MQLLKQILVLLFLAAWLPATNHCYLEMAGLLPADDCGETQETSPISGDPCDTGCKLIEKTVYKPEAHQKFVLVAVLLPAIFQTLLEPASAAPANALRLAAWPPDTFHLPQFVMRTALPVRAPALA